MKKEEEGSEKRDQRQGEGEGEGVSGVVMY